MRSYKTHGVRRGPHEGKKLLILVLGAAAEAASKTILFPISNTSIALLVNPFQLGKLSTILFAVESTRTHASPLARRF